jgi:hypothetical protein
LTVDPLDAPPGAAWASDPYSYAGNNPVGLSDPAGLSPVTDADLQAWADSHQSHWEYVVGAAAMIAGGAATLIPFVGPAIGGALISAGLDTIIQKATTGSVDWGQVAVNGVIGAVGGGVGGAVAGAFAKAAAAKAAEEVALTLGQHVLQGVATGAASGLASGTVSGGVAYSQTPGPHTASGYATAITLGGLTGAVGGGVTGGVGAALGHGLTTIGGRLLNNTPPTPTPGTVAPKPGSLVYRVWGQDPSDPDAIIRQSGPWGRSWTRVNPNTVSDYRDTAGLPNLFNKGRFVSTGILNDTTGVIVKSADPIGPNAGGLDELIVPNPQTQIILSGVAGVNLEF